MKSINFKMCPHGMLTLWGWVRFSSNSDHLHYWGWHVWPYEERSIMINVWECVGGFQSSVDSAWDRVVNSTSINVINGTHEDRNWFESTQFHRIMYYILLYTISYYMYLYVLCYDYKFIGVNQRGFSGEPNKREMGHVQNASRCSKFSWDTNLRMTKHDDVSAPGFSN